MSVIRRLIPGDYSALREISHPALEELGISFEYASVINSPISKPVLYLFTCETLGENREPLSGFIRNKGNWNLVFDQGEVKSSASLWFLTVMDYPDRFLKSLHGVSTGNGLLFRPMKSGWLVGFQSQLIKQLIKHGNRRDTQF